MIWTHLLAFLLGAVALYVYICVDVWWMAHDPPVPPRYRHRPVR